MADRVLLVSLRIYKTLRVFDVSQSVWHIKPPAADGTTTRKYGTHPSTDGTTTRKYSNSVPPLTELPPASMELIPPLTELPPASMELIPPLTELPPASMELTAPLTELPPASMELIPPLTELPPASMEFIPPLTELPPASIKLAPLTIELLFDLKEILLIFSTPLILSCNVVANFITLQQQDESPFIFITFCSILFNADLLSKSGSRFILSQSFSYG